MPRRRFDGITMAQLSGCAIVFAAWLFIDQIPGHGADKLRLLGVMREHSVSRRFQAAIQDSAKAIID